MSASTKRVLVVDDNADSAYLVAEMLRLKGYDVVVVSDPQAALEIVPTFLPEVALLDIGLPGVDGYELARRIAQSGSGCRLIAVTGYGHERDRVRALESGFAVHLVKPATISAILAAIVPGDHSGEPTTIADSAEHEAGVDLTLDSAPNALLSVPDRG
jgi:CheY-like chemotaxis protein